MSTDSPTIAGVEPNGPGRAVAWRNTLTQYELPEGSVTDVEKAPGTERHYLGHPDIVRTRTGKLLCMYPIGHGQGPIVMRVSHDDGETWVEKTDIPHSWKGTQETPTLFSLTLADGRERILLVTGNPGWGTDLAGHSHGWNTSFSDDDGETWTEYRHWYATHPSTGEDNQGVVAMASLIQLRDENGEPAQKWMGVYHDHQFRNYATILTFDEGQGIESENWSEPRPYLAEHRDLEKLFQMCEIGMYRSRMDGAIVGLARVQSHHHGTALIVSHDEGETWSAPVELPGSLAGDRHKPVYCPVSGRILVSMREIRYDLDGDGVHGGADDWRAGDWVAWVGTEEQLRGREDGQYRLLLSRDFSLNRYGGDTGYPGVATLEDGTFIIHSYGHFDEEYSKAHYNGNIKEDLCYVRQAKFRLADVEELHGI